MLIKMWINILRKENWGWKSVMMADVTEGKETNLVLE